MSFASPIQSQSPSQFSVSVSVLRNLHHPCELREAAGACSSILAIRAAAMRPPGSDPGCGGKFRVDVFGLAAGEIERSVVVDDVVGERNLLAVRHLRGEPCASIRLEFGAGERIGLLM